MANYSLANFKQGQVRANQSGWKCLIRNDPFQSDPYSHSTGGILSSKMYSVYFIRLSGELKKTIKERKHHKRWKCLIHSLLLSGSQSSDDCAAHSCSHRCLLHVLQVSSVLLWTPWLHGLGFLTDCFHWMSITLDLSLTRGLSFIIEAQNINQTISDYCHALRYDPCEKMTFPSQSEIQELIH